MSFQHKRTFPVDLLNLFLDFSTWIFEMHQDALAALSKDGFASGDELAMHEANLLEWLQKIKVVDVHQWLLCESFINFVQWFMRRLLTDN